MSTLGAFSELAGITEHVIENGPLPNIKDISNGLALELKSYCDKKGHKPAYFVKILTGIDQQFSTASVTAIVNKVNYLKTQKSKLLHKKKVKGVKNVNELLQNPFKCPQSKCTSDNLNSSTDTAASASEPVVLETTTLPTPPIIEQFHISTATQTYKTNEYNDGVKNLNVLTYKTKLKEKRLEKVNIDLQKCHEQLNSIRGHYSVKNINKRDQTARQNLKKLRNSERIVRKQQAALKYQSVNLASITELHDEIDRLNCANLKLKDQFDLLSECADQEKNKKVALQKSNSYLKGEIYNLKSKLHHEQTVCENCVSSEEKIKVLKLEVKEKEQCRSDLEEELLEINSKPIPTKDDKGMYTPNVRLCILELTALEVATEKMAPVIRSVISHLAGKEINDLPNKTTSQKIIDEGHYLCKAFIADKLENSKYWGMGRDGTTRRKQKILDTSITLETGETMTLGFTRVAQETATTIQTVTENHLDKLKLVTDNPSYLADTLSKLSFTMSDRASNEKKVYKLLDEWRNEMLSDYPGEKEDVLHFHCMAHVLLGLHNYTTPLLKDFEQSLKDKNPNPESEKVSFFTPWKSESVTSRVVRQVSDTFAPAGSHLGVRDRWEAFCAKNGTKSLIGNYKDNRFNALFQTAAEVYVHRRDFVSVLETVLNENGKLASVKKELESENITTILQCLGLFYLKFTGPYWNLVTSGKVPYLHLWEHVAEIVQFLETLESDPAHLLVKDQHRSPSDPLDVKRLPNRATDNKRYCVITQLELLKT